MTVHDSKERLSDAEADRANLAGELLYTDDADDTLLIDCVGGAILHGTRHPDRGRILYGLSLNWGKL